ncbi:hypothetical protein IMZ68_02355, partial [Candidatus Bathyarchaeota archaeon]|nr:hypothetical protein [Candidatus Bathyarchaeota archaeon]
MVFSTTRVKTIAVALFLILTIAVTTVALPDANAHTPPWKITTYAYITASPNPIGVNQVALVVFWIDKIFGPDIALTNNWRFHNYILTITAPDGTNSTRTFDVVKDTTSVQTISYIPEQVGTYTFNFNFLGQDYAQYANAYNPASILVNDTFLPSSASTTLTVQQEPVPSPISSYPLPNEYWTRPIYGENTDWWTISSNWLGTGAPVLSSVGSGDITGFPQQSAINRYPGDAIGPQTAHIMWAMPIESGGVVGGNTFPIPGNTYFEGSAYNQRFTNPIIINGILYYTNPVTFTGTTAGQTIAVDIRTGKVFWVRNDVPALSFGYIYDVEDPNQHGVYPPILFTSNFARAFDAYTGNIMFNVSGVPSGMEAMGPQGEHLRYTLTNLGNSSNPDYRLAQWNSTNLWTWSGLSPALTNASNGASWSMIGSTVAATTNVIGTYNPGTFIVDGSVFNSSDPQNRYDYNVSIPWRNTMPSAPTVLAVFYNNMMLLRNGTYPIQSLTSLTGIVSSATPYTYFAVNLNASRGQIGSLLWTQTFNAPPGNVTVTFAGADPTVGVFTEGIKETAQWVGYSLTTGQRLWGPVGNQSAWDYFGNPAFNYAASQVAYGKLYSSAYGGILYCYDLTNGKLLWTYGNGGAGNTTRTGTGVPAYGGYPTFINA